MKIPEAARRGPCSRHMTSAGAFAVRARGSAAQRRDLVHGSHRARIGLGRVPQPRALKQGRTRAHLATIHLFAIVWR